MVKRFKDMTSAEIKAMSDEDFKAVSPFEKRTCYDCGHLKHALHWWCTNESAIKLRGTRIPGIIKCPYWKPDWSVIPDKYKTEENGYVKPIVAIIEKKRNVFQKIVDISCNIFKL